MDAVRIEQNSINALSLFISSHNLMVPSLASNDREPIWDGFIYLLKEEEYSSENIAFRVPVQVKGKNKPELLKRSFITYPVPYGNLRAYFNDGGVVFFVIVISDDARDREIFVNALTPLKLADLLKNSESKGNSSTKNIALERIDKDNQEGLYRKLLQFAVDSKQQGRGSEEILRNAISSKDICNVDMLKTTSAVPFGPDFFSGIKSGEICVYGHKKTADLWAPFLLEEQQRIEIKKVIEITKEFGIDGTIFYHKIRCEESEDQKAILLSENIKIDVDKWKINFHPVSEMNSIIYDISFLNALKEGKTFTLDGKPILGYSNPEYPEEMEANMNSLVLFANALSSFGISFTDRMDTVNEEEKRKINDLIYLSLGQIIPKSDCEWYLWKWRGHTYPFILLRESDGKIRSVHATLTDDFCIMFDEEGNKYRAPLFILYKHDIWEHLAEFDVNELIEKFNQSDFAPLVLTESSKMFLEVLTAYDNSSREEYYVFAKAINDCLLEKDPQNVYWEINNYQLKRRKERLDEKEYLRLEELHSISEDPLVILAASILLDNKRNAKKEFEALTDIQRNTFLSFPICKFISELKELSLS